MVLEKLLVKESLKVMKKNNMKYVYVLAKSDSARHIFESMKFEPQSFDYVKWHVRKI